jgi:hypothetical protein
MPKQGRDARASCHEPDLLAFIRSAPDFDLFELERAGDGGRESEL